MKNYFIVLLFTSLLFSCSYPYDNSLDTNELLNKNYKKSYSEESFGELSDDFNSEIPHEYIEALNKIMRTESEISYNSKTGEISVEDMIIHENLLAPYIIDDRILAKLSPEEKGYTFSPNHTTNSSIPSNIRCGYGQTLEDFEDYQVITTYTFESSFPSALRSSIVSAFAAWSTSSNSKFIFNEVSSGGHMSVEWNDLGSPLTYGKGSFPVWGISQFMIGNKIQFNQNTFDLTTGYLKTVEGDSDQRIKDFLTNVAQHEIGHTLGLAHLHNALSVGAYHVIGTLTQTSQFDVSLMSYYRNRYNSSGILADDITTIQTLYPYSGASLQCNSTNQWPDIQNAGYFLPLALGDVDNSGNASTLDIVKLQRYMLGLPNHYLTPYGIQKGAGISSSGSTTSVTGTDLSQLQSYILGYDPWNESITSGQWLALADANGDGLLTSIDISATYLPVGSAVWGPNNQIVRANFTTEIQSSCSLIDGNGSLFDIYEYDVWVNNL